MNESVLILRGQANKAARRVRRIQAAARYWLGTVYDPAMDHLQFQQPINPPVFDPGDAWPVLRGCGA
jgi:hypothetical protein